MEKSHSGAPEKNGLGERNESRSSSSDVRETPETTVVASQSEKIVESMTKHKKSFFYSDEPEVQRIVNFLREKNVSENLIGRVLKNGIANGFDRLLRALGVTCAEMKNFEWKSRLDSCDFAYDSLQSDVAGTESFVESTMSPDNLYLRRYFGDVLPRAMKEIVKRRPNDPIDFLGHWLVNYEVCRERDNRRIEFEAELDAERILSKESEMDRQSEITGYDGQAKSLENYGGYGEYEDPEMQQ